MRITLLLAIAAVLYGAQDVGERGSLPGGSSISGQSQVTTQARPVDTPATEVILGDIAPDFAYQGDEARWRRLRELVARQPALLVFGASDAVLRALEAERETLLERGVLPVVVLPSRLGSTRATVQRLNLKYMVLADPRGVIASQFNAVDPASGRQLPAWFVLDTQRRVQALGRGRLPKQGYGELAAEALGLPSSASVPAQR
jgi:peroxiredoxin